MAKQPINIFTPLFPKERLDLNFLAVINSPVNLESAKAMINQIFDSWEGFDNHFVQEFQTTNFNARLWELYLYATFKSMGFAVEKCPEGRPDFCLKKGNTKIYVEAVTSSPNHSLEPKPTMVTFDEENEELSLLKIRNALTGKIKRSKYWDLPWVKGYPVILAFSPFHSPEALNIVDFLLIKYFYGSIINRRYDEQGRVQITESRVTSHAIFNKEIPNFFDDPRAENISAILYSNSATLGKFTRMGYQAGYGTEKITSFFYSGSCYNDDPNSLGLGQFYTEIKASEPREFTDEWRFGMSLFYNHNAMIPLPQGIFDQMTQYMYDDQEGFFRKMLSFHPYNAKNLRSEYY